MLRRYKIFVDDAHVGTIARNGVLDVEVPSGHRTVQARIDWCRSKPVTIDAQPSQATELEVANHWGALLSLWGVTFGAQSYLDLKPSRPS